VALDREYVENWCFRRNLVIIMRTLALLLAGLAAIERIPHVSATSKLDRVVVINDDGAERGGAAAIAIASLRLLHARGVQVTFLYGDSAYLGELPEGIRTSILGGRYLLEGARPFAAMRGLFDPQTAARLARWIDMNDTPGTVYHLHNWHKILSPSVFKPLRRVADRLVLTAHDYFLACPNGGYFLYPQQTVCEIVPGTPRCLVTACDRRNYGHKLWRVLRHTVRQWLIDLNSAGAVIVAVHEKMTPLLARGGIDRNRIVTLRNPVTRLRAERVQAERNKDVLFIGRVERDKGVDLLARAARRAGARLRIIGDGSLAPMIADRHPEVELLGWQCKQRIGELVESARLFVMPTRWRETFGLAPIEALMSGIPVIISRSTLISDEVVEHGFGLACDPQDEEGLAATIRELIDDNVRVADMSRRAFAGARQLAPTPAEWCEQLLALYESRAVGGTRSTASMPLMEPQGTATGFVGAAR